MKIWIQFEFFSFQISNRSTQQFIKIMRHNFGRKSYSNSFYTLSQKQREFYRQVNRFIISTVIRFAPFCSFRVENHFQSKRCKSCFNISGCRCRISCIDISPVSLGINEQFFLANLHHRIRNRSITMRMIFHGISYNIGNFIISTVL